MSQEEKPSTSQASKQPLQHYFVPVGLDREGELEKGSRKISNVTDGAYSEFGHTERTKSSDSVNKDFEDDVYNASCWLGLSKRQWLIFTVLLLVDFFAGVVYSIKGPFYPREAELKGASATQYGLVFGVFDLAKCIASPVYGHFMNKFGSRNVFYFGMLTVGLCSILFGLLHQVEDTTNFVIFSFLIRILEALGNAAFSTAAFTTIICEFPDSIATAFASFETTFGIGLIVGPMMGGVFYELGGYPTPFIVTGALLFFSFGIIALIMPPPLNTVTEVGHKGNKYSDIFLILSLPGVLLSAFAVLVAASSVGFITATLEPHIRQFELTPVQTGLIFIIFGTVYAVFAPIWGWICDRIHKPRYILFIGSTLNTLAFLIVGPAPFLEFDTQLWISSVGLVLQGLGVSAVFVSGFLLALRYSINHGFPDNVSTYSVISGLWTSVTALGMFIGPSAAGVLLDKVGFRWGSLMLLASSALLAMLILTFIVVEALYSTADDYPEDVNDENERLLRQSPSNSSEKSLSKSTSYGSLK